jgi:hypothetical protein
VAHYSASIILGPLLWDHHFGAGDASRLAFRQKFLRLGNRFGKPDPLDFDIWRKGACHAGWQTAIKHHKHAAIIASPDQPSKGLA